jgi:hypothetical protein
VDAGVHPSTSALSHRTRSGLAGRGAHYRIAREKQPPQSSRPGARKGRLPLSRPTGIRCLLPQPKAAVLPPSAGQLPRPLGLTEEQPARDLSRPPPRPVGATIGPGRPARALAPCHDERPGQPAGPRAVIAPADDYCSPASGDSRRPPRRRRPARCRPRRGRCLRRTPSRCAAPTPGCCRGRGASSVLLDLLAVLVAERRRLLAQPGFDVLAEARQPPRRLLALALLALTLGPALVELFAAVGGQVVGQPLDGDLVEQVDHQATPLSLLVRCPRLVRAPSRLSAAGARGTKGEMMCRLPGPRLTKDDVGSL